MNDDWKTWKFAGIYGIRHGSDGKIYVGQSQNIAQRIYCHKSIDAGCTHLHRAIGSYGWDAFDVVVLEKVKDITLLNEREQHWIDNLESHNPEKGYNIHRTVGAKIKCRANETEVILSSRQSSNDIWKSVKIRLSTYQAIRRLAAEWLCGIDDAIARLIAEYQARTPDKGDGGPQMP